MEPTNRGREDTDGEAMEKKGTVFHGYHRGMQDGREIGVAEVLSCHTRDTGKKTQGKAEGVLEICRKVNRLYWRMLGEVGGDCGC